MERMDMQSRNQYLKVLRERYLKVKAFQAKYNYAPGEDEQGPYLGSLVAIKALEATGGDTTPDKLRQAILKLQFEAPPGFTLRFDQKTRSTFEDVYIIKIDKRGNDYVWVPVYTYKDVPPEGF